MLRSISSVLTILGLALSTGARLTAQRDSTGAEESGLAQMGSIPIPLDDETGWKRLRYRGIPPNDVEFSATGLHILVDRSGGPIVYPLPSPATVMRLAVRGRLEGDLRLGGGRQGEKGFDDYVCRAGLVLRGERRLRGLRRLFAPQWVRRLHALALPNEGISTVRFFNVGADVGRIGDRRVHPLSDLLEEEIAAVARADGTFEIDATLSPPVETVALWLSSDGDDTGSVFSVVIERITLTEGGRPDAKSSPNSSR